MIAFLGFMFAAAVAPGTDPQTAQELSQRAAQLYSQSRYAEAEPLFRKALDGWNRMGPDAARQGAIDERNLGAVLRAEGKYQEAEPILTGALQKLESSGAGTMEVERALYNLAALYRTSGDAVKAEAFALRAEELLQNHPEVPEAERQAPRVVLASIYLDQRRYVEAETQLKAALEGADGPIAASAYNGLATIAMSRLQFAQAEEFAGKALYFARMSLPAGHPAVASAWNSLAQACRFQERYMEAEKHYRTAISTWEESLGPSHPMVAQGLMNLGAFYHERGREAGAETLYLRAAGILEQVFGKNDPRTLAARNELAEVLRAERRYTESEKLGRSTMAAMAKTLPADDPRLVRAQVNFARLQASKGASASCTASCKTEAPE